MKSNRILTLAELSPGGIGRVVDIRSGTGLRLRLESMGLRVGQKIAKVSGLPLGGPVVVQIGATRIALGHGMAKKVAVETARSSDQ